MAQSKSLPWAQWKGAMSLSYDYIAVQIILVYHTSFAIKDTRNLVCGVCLRLAWYTRENRC